MRQNHASGRGLRSAYAGSAVLIILVVYLAVSLHHLADFPAIGQDEAWIASAPYKLATEGVYGSDLFAGYYGMDQHNFDHMPVYPLLQSGVFKLLGAGTFQMRILPVALGFALLLLVFAAGCQLGNAYAGALAAALLIGLRVGAGDGSTGILLLDLARVNRYDIAVPVFGLLALLAFNRGEDNNSRYLFVLSGIFAGLSSLSHLYGAFWLPALIAILLYRRRRNVFHQPAAYLMLAGFLALWIPWLGYIAGNWTDYVNQTRPVADRFDVFNPSFYASNLLREIDRYRPLGIWSSSGTLGRARPGTWAVVFMVPSALIWMLWHFRRRAPHAGFTLAGAAIVQTALFGLLLKAKTYAYLIALWPLGALAIAWMGIRLWEIKKTAPVIRVALLALLALILAEGTVRIGQQWRLAGETTSYEQFTRRIASCIPAGSLVLGLQQYWMGLREYPYRTWLVPVYFTHPLYYHERLAMDAALERVKPDAILIDRYMNEYFERIRNDDHPDHHLYEGFQSFMARHSARLECVIDDTTYQTMRVYLMKL